MTRPSGRAPDELRRVSFARRFAKHAEGSVLIECGDTQVLCTASVEETIPPFLRGKGQGWVTAEYGMLPRSTHTRSAREARRREIALVKALLKSDDKAGVFGKLAGEDLEHSWWKACLPNEFTQSGSH